MSGVPGARLDGAIRDRFPCMRRLTGVLNMALFLAGGAADAAELREWLQVTGVLATTPAPEGAAVPAEKHCPRCDKDKAASEWYRNAASQDGLDTCCKACRAAYVGSGDQLERRRERYNPEQQRGRLQVGVPLPPELHAPLSEEAAARGISMGAVVREALAERYEARLREAS